MKLPALQAKATRVVVENASTLFTGGGAVGTVVTAVLTGKATFKAAEIIRDHEVENIRKDLFEEGEEAEETGVETMGLKTSSKAKLVWKYYIPPVIVGSATVGSIVMAHRVSAARIAALAAAYGVVEGRFDEYRTKVAEKLTGPKNEQLSTEIAQKHVDENPASKQVIIVGGGDVLCYDMMSGRYFRSSVEQIKRAESELNMELFDAQMVSLSEFYDKLGLPRTLMSDMLGWTALTDGAIGINISTTLSEDQQPCLVLDYSRTPEANFTRIVD